MKRLPWLAPLPALIIAGPLVAQDAPKPEPIAVPDVVKGITARELGGHMKFLASDLMRGRDTTSLEIRIAAEYLASRLSAAGAEPAGDADPSGRLTYFQKYPLEVTTASQEGSGLSIEIDRDGSKRVIPLQLGPDLLFLPTGIAPGEVEAPVVFAGYGRSIPAEKVDDYEGLDVKDRFVLVLAGQPPAKPKEGEEKAAEKPQPKGRQGGRNRQGLMAHLPKLEPAAKRGALGVIVIQPSTAAARPGPAPIPPLAMLGFGRPSMALAPIPSAIPLLVMADTARDQMIQAIPLPSDQPAPRPLPGVRAKFTFNAKKEWKDDRNVVGFFPGSDPEKRKEVVIFSAHYDHVGVDESGVIFNGSDDNASGTSALLEIAEAFGDGPRPARSVAFLWVSGEEKGLLGSHWFSDHVSLPADCKIVADIKIDMVSRNDGKSIGLTPSGDHPSHTSLVESAEAAAGAEGLEIKFDADQFFNRTDSANFARKGIPVVFFFSGVHEDYHKSTDDVEKADFDKAARVARAAYRLGWQVAQAPEAPKKIKTD
jgi:hypothetical protein